MDTELALIGGGLQGVLLAGALVREGRSITVLDPQYPLDTWIQTTTRQGMEALRSPWKFHLDFHDPDSLKRHHRLRGGYASSNPAPPLQDFNEHALDYVHRRSLEDHWRHERVESVELRPDGRSFSLRTSGAGGHVRTMTAEKVVVCVGMGSPYMPDLGPACVQVSHSDHIDVSERSRFQGRRVAVVGAGQTGATVAVQLCRAGAEVVLFCRRDMETSQLDHPREWLPGESEFLRFARLSPEARLRELRATKGHVTVTPAIYSALQNASASRACTVLLHTPVERWELLPGGVRINGRDEYVFDEVVLCTGYASDVRSVPFLAPVLPRMATAGPWPLLTGDLRVIGVPNLYFMGKFSEMTTGPLGRNLPGGWYATELLMNTL